MRILTLLTVVLVALPVSAAENDFKAIFARHWQTSKEFTLAVAEAMPAEDYDFKPNPEEMSFGGLMIHIAEENSSSFARAEARGQIRHQALPCAQRHPECRAQQTSRLSCGGRPRPKRARAYVPLHDRRATLA